MASLQPFPAADWKFALRVGLIIALTVIIYFPVLHGEWLWDDNVDITENPTTQNPTGWWTIWSEPGSQADYYPVKATVQWAQWQLWGADTFGYHLTNLLLHIVGALLVWRLLSKLGLKFAWLGGLLFSIHPANVESVAWIAELKNTLSLPPFLLAMCTWIDFEEHRRKRDYALAVTLFLIAMLCKTTMVMFPFIILLYAWWKRSRIGWRDVKVSLPLFAISFGLGLLTLVLQNSHISHVPFMQSGGFFWHVVLAGESLAFYFFACFLPVGPTLMYPQWKVDPVSPFAWLPWLVMGGLIFWWWTQQARWGRHVLLGVGFFLLNLAPILGFVSTGYMRFTWVMDHFLYLPIIGLIGLAVAGWDELESRLPVAARWGSRAAGAVVIGLLTLRSWSYAQTFNDQQSLWIYTLQQNPDAWLAHNNLGEMFRRAGRASDARREFEKALQINPDSVEAHNNMGVISWATGQGGQAMEQFHEALKIDPTYAQAHYNLGVGLGTARHLPEAIAEYREALKYNPLLAAAHDNLGAALLNLGRTDEARQELETALGIDPTLSHGHYNMGNLFFTTGQLARAEAEYEQALKLDPDFGDAYDNLGVALAKQGRVAEAIAQIEIALRLDPKNAQARDNLAQLQGTSKK